MDGLFADLEQEELFVSFISEHFRQSPTEIASVMHCTNHIDEERIRYSFGEYKQNLEKFDVFLRSRNPDHYKRAGALLHSLHESEIITKVDLESTAEELEAGYTRVNYGDAEHILKFVEFYETYYNQMMCFDVSYRACAAYENTPVQYDFDYLYNMCRYLRSNSNLALDTFFMMFKSLMAR